MEDKTRSVPKRKSKSPEDAGESKKRADEKTEWKQPGAETGTPVKTKIMRDPVTGLWRREALTEAAMKPGEYELVLLQTFFRSVVHCVVSSF